MTLMYVCTCTLFNMTVNATSVGALVPPQVHREISEMEGEMVHIHEAAQLFEVNTSDYKQLKACRKDVGMLKNLWDMIFLVRSSFDAWKTTLWKDINVEQMDMDCKKFVKDIRALDKEMRAWDAFSGLDSAVKNMVTSLRAVGELQNQAIRDRHWEQLMQATGVSRGLREGDAVVCLCVQCACVSNAVL